MPSEPSTPAYNYATLRIVPRVHRDEFINAGVVLYSPERRFLGARVHVDERRLRALWPHIDVALVRRHLSAVEHIANGSKEGGPIAALKQGERFHWLTAPRSAMIQVSPVRTGISNDPGSVLESLAADLVEVQPVTR